MKYCFTFILTAFLVSNTVRATQEKPLQSTLTDVRVYTRGAMLYHKTNYSVSSGVNKVIIEGISTNISPQTLQLTVSGDVVILDSKYELYYPEPAPIDKSGFPAHITKSITLLSDSISNITDTITDINNQISVIKSSKLILTNNGAIKGQGKVNDSIPMLKEALEYYFKKMNELNTIQMKLERQEAETTKKLNRMRERLEALKNYGNSNGLSSPVTNQPVPRIIVTLQASQYVSGKINLSYLINNAGWSPQYDLRSSGTQNTIDLTYKANIYQNSGIKWENVKLSLSTNDPHQNRNKPELHPWYIDYQMYNQQPQSGAIQQDAYKRLSKQEEMAEYETTKDKIASESKSSADFTTIVQHMISAEFVIDLSYTIPSDNKSHMILVNNEKLPATFKHYAAPKLNESVYLVAELTNLEDLQLLPARANVFFDGAYMGETYLDPGSMNDTLRLGLGIDQNVLIKRRMDKKSFKEKLLGSQKMSTYYYEIEIKNQKSSTIHLVIEDQVPVTNNEEIEIEILDKGKARLNETTGILEWNMTLKGKENKTLRFGYSVKSDKHKQLFL